MMSNKGEDHGRSILDDFEVLKIYNDRRSLRKIAADFNVSHSTVHAIKSGRLWAHVTARAAAEQIDAGTSAQSEPEPGVL